MSQVHNTQGDKIIIVRYCGIVMSKTVEIAATDRGRDTIMLLLILIHLRCHATVSCSHTQTEKNHRLRGK